MTAYYNEIDAYAAAWLRNLIDAGHLPAGDIDTRSIVEVQPDDIKGYDEAHFFAGISGWPLALKMAGWTGGPVWTGSCPCQPFSAAGRQRGTDDERHLWPEFFRLIAECRPATLFGEQVASRAGRDWLARVLDDLESVGYAVAGADLCAASVGAPHIRQRLYWTGARRGRAERHDDWHCANCDQPIFGGCDCDHGERKCQACGEWTYPFYYDDADGCSSCGVVNATAQGLQRQSLRLLGASYKSYAPWHSYSLLDCLDRSLRRVEPGTFPLADGVPARVGRLRAYGNAIVPQVAAEFIRASQC